MFRNIPPCLLKFVRYKPIHADLEPNPMPYTSKLWKTRLPHRMRSAYDISHDYTAMDFNDWPTLIKRLAFKEKDKNFTTIGYELVKQERSMFNKNLEIYKANKSSALKVKQQREHKLNLNVQTINREWINERSGIQALHSLAHHYKIFEHLMK
ncbi:hypothetical protein GJ496_011315 [Pomphorhynchus laevis]|nr:hypothetical protein GJ496_011315 [Pomphorhynchus laevis]